MSFTTGTPVNLRRIIDAGLSVNTALPNGSAATSATNWIDLRQPGATSAYWTANTAGTTTPPAGTTLSPAGPYVATERVLVNVLLTASANGGNNGNAGANIAVYLQQAPSYANGTVDTGNITNVPLRSSFNVTGNVGYVSAVSLNTGASSATAALNIFDALPPGIQEYIRLYAVNGSAVGNAADATMTLQVVF